MTQTPPPSSADAPADRPAAPAAEISFPEHLPVAERREEIMAAVRDHQVVIVAGETGSGKTTQLPKMLLALGLGEAGVVGHTQPRRLAARSVAERIAEELGQGIGQTVGYQVRFTAEISKATRVKVMTDGILLAEIPHDPDLRRYSAIIIDEAHERSLNIDFLLGYLKRLLPRRPDLKVIITSATIDPESFARHFGRPIAEGEEHEDAVEADDGARVVPAPIIEVSGRTYPVEIRYRPLAQEPEPDDPDDDADDRAESRDPVEAVGDAVLELAGEPDGDILVFFPGEREIRDAADHLAGVVASSPRLAGTEILPLFGRLSMAEQHRVFGRAAPGVRRRIVLATNVAETSLTVPGIRYVVDTGTARISRYSHRTKVQRLPIERISQASANQRSGRSGRTSPGIAIRLYSEEDFLSRPEFTDPEILRTSLASVILQMLSLGVAQTPADVQDFPFVQRPDGRQVSDGATALTELGALHAGTASGAGRGGRGAAAGTITPIGRRLARLPVDPRLGRMILESGERGCVREVMVLAAALTIQDPRERPTEHREAADEMHRRFADENSDFTSILNLWAYLREQQKELSGSAFRRMCRREHINYLRVREWQDLVQQLRQIATDVGVSVQAGPVDPVGQHDAVHKALLTGLLSQIGAYDERRREYAGARGTRFAVFPGSALFKKRHPFVMAAELVETSRLWARTVARIDPEWVEEVAGDLVKRTYNEPHWSRRAGSAVAREKVSLFGVTLVPERPVRYGRIDPVLSRELFLRHALVEGDWRTRHRFFARNRQALEEVEALETRLRRRDLRVGDEELFAFYDARVPASVVSERHFDAWWKKARHETPDLLDLDVDALLTQDADALDTDAFPTSFRYPLPGGEVELALDYTYDPTGASGTDGITVAVPVLLLGEVSPGPFAWLVPGLRVELVTALIKALPKAVRRGLVPAPDVARQLVADLDAHADPLHNDLAEALSAAVRRVRGAVVEPSLWLTDAVPDHLRMDYRVVDARGAVMGAGQDLPALQARLAQANRSAIAARLAGTDDPANARPGPAGRGRGRGRGRDGAQDGAGRPAGPASSPGALDAAGRPGGTGDRTAGGAPAFRERHGLTSWSIGTLERRISTAAGARGPAITGYPALVPETTADGAPAAGLVVARSAEDQAAWHRAGVIALLLATMPSTHRYVMDHLDNREKLTFTQNPHGSVDSLVRDSTHAAVDRLVGAELPFSEAEFRALYDRVRADLIDTVFAVTSLVEKVLAGAAAVRRRLKGSVSLATAPAKSDVKAHLEQLVFDGFVAATGWTQLQHLPRYMQGMLVRLDKLDAGGHLQRDGQSMAVVQGLEDEFDAAVAAHRARFPGTPVPAELDRVRWLIEELRVSFFAQELGTAVSVSEKRVRQALQKARAATP